jgi:hypothetical protein
MKASERARRFREAEAVHRRAGRGMFGALVLAGVGVGISALFAVSDGSWMAAGMLGVVAVMLILFAFLT